MVNTAFKPNTELNVIHKKAALMYKIISFNIEDRDHHIEFILKVCF